MPRTVPTGLAEVEFTAVADLIRVLGVLPAHMRTALGPGVLRAANIIADQYRANAVFSSRIPSAVYARLSLTSSAGAVVGANARIAPEAKVLEVGNTGPGDAIFRHPVFGHDTWVYEKTHPALFPAVEQKGQAARDAVAEVVLAVARAEGFSVV